jgi:hypothetical protein
MPSNVRAYLEIGTKRVFAGALEWPGWARSGRTDEAALEALAAYAGRYSVVVAELRLGFEPVEDATAFEVVERVTGDASTDFGAPGVAPAVDGDALRANEATRQLAILAACWRKLERAVEDAAGRELTKGPRGGGRSVDKIVDHVVGAEAGYLSRIGRKLEPSGLAIGDVAEASRAEVETAVRDGIPPSPRGGKRWTVRYFVRRSAWHILDHAWEIEDRTPA